MNRGFLIMDILIAISFFLAVFLSVSILIFQSQSILQGNALRLEAIKLAESYIGSAIDTSSFDREGFQINISTEPIDNFTTKKTVTVNYLYRGRDLTFSLQEIFVDLSESEGQSSCRPSFQGGRWKPFSVSSFDVSSVVSRFYPNDIDVVGNYAYIASDSSVAADPDLFIFDISGGEVRLVSSLNTGPGMLSLHVVGDRVFAGNTSINAQLQSIDISDRSAPKLVVSFKLPGIYTDNTTIGNELFYKAGKVFLGTKKSQAAEFYVVDVSSSEFRVLDSLEIGSAVNGIYAYKNKVYVATAHSDAELIMVDLSSEDTFDSYEIHNLPGGTGTGKSIALSLGNLSVGRNKTLYEQDGMYRFNAETHSILKSIPMDVSVLQLFSYGDFVYTLVNSEDDAFKIYSTSLDIIQMNQSVHFPATPLAFDCDRDTFVILLKDSPILYFISLS